MKCQKLGASHITADCMQQHDTCGSCGENHRTTNCTTTDPSNFFSVNCKVNGHAAWDRHCPIFNRLSARFNTNHPKNSYRHFPIASDPSSWESREPQGEEKTGSPTDNNPGYRTHGYDQMEESWETVNRHHRPAHQRTTHHSGRAHHINTGDRNRTSQCPGPYTKPPWTMGGHRGTRTARTRTLPNEFTHTGIRTAAMHMAAEDQ